MKRSFCIFAALCALALIFCIGANAALMADAGTYVPTGATVAGDASAAEGLVLRTRDTAQRHLVWEGEYEPDTGRGAASARWSFEDMGNVFSLSALLPVRGGLDFTETVRLSGGVWKYDFLRDIYEDVVRPHEDENVDVSVNAADYVDEVPLTFSFYGLDGTCTVMVPSEGMRFDVEYGRGSGTMEVSLNANGISSYGDAQICGDWVYFSYDFNYNLNTDSRYRCNLGLMRAHCPGGVLEDGSAEQIMANVTRSSKLTAGSGRVYVVENASGGALDVTVIDAATGEVTGERELLSAGEMDAFGLDMGCAVSCGGGALLLDGRVAVPEDGGVPVDMSSVPVPEELSALGEPEFEVMALKYDGRRLAAALRAEVELELWHYRFVNLLAVWQDGELALVQTLSCPAEESSLGMQYHWEYSFE